MSPVQSIVRGVATGLFVLFTAWLLFAGLLFWALLLVSLLLNVALAWKLLQ